MRVALLGKVGSMIGWLEACAGGLRADGCEVLVAASRNPARHRALEAALLSERIGAPMAASIARSLRAFAPRITLVIGAYEIPRPILERVAAIPGRAPLVAWIGDMFSQSAAPIAALFDTVAYTDSGLVERHRRLEFGPPAIFLPHAANPYAARGAPAARRERMVFIANPTDHRRRVTSAVTAPLAIFGPGWRRGETLHEIHDRKVGQGELPRLYASHFAALNIRNEHNVLFGLNQRSFDPYVFATPVVTDDQPDLAACFEPGAEALVWRDAGELDDLYARLRREPALAAAVGERGRARVLADHTYGRRLAALAALTGAGQER